MLNVYYNFQDFIQVAIYNSLKNVPKNILCWLCNAVMQKQKYYYFNITASIFINRTNAKQLFL